MKKELIEKRNQVLADYEKLQNEAKTRAFTTEDNTRADAMLAELEAIDKSLERESRYDKVKAATSQAANTPVNEDRAGVTPEGEQRKAYRKFLATGETRGLNETTAAQGGYLAPADLAKGILSIVIEQSQLRPMARVVETGLASVPFPRKSAGPSGAWVAESGTVNASQSTYASVGVGINKFAFNTPVSLELLQDGLFDVEAQIMSDIAIECARGENAGFIAGTGTTQPTGLTNVATNGVTAVKSGTNLVFAADDLIKLMFSVKQPYIDKGTWFINRLTFAAIAKMKTSAGNYVFSPSGLGTLAGNGFAPTILNRPFSLSPDMPLSGLAGGTGTPYSVLYTDPSASYAIVQKPASQLVTIVRDPYTAASTGNVVFWVYYRVGGGVVMPEAVALLQESA